MAPALGAINRDATTPTILRPASEVRCSDRTPRSEQFHWSYALWDSGDRAGSLTAKRNRVRVYDRLLDLDRGEYLPPLIDALIDETMHREGDVPGCLERATTAMTDLDGVVSVQPLPRLGDIEVDYWPDRTDPTAIAARLQQAGFPVREQEHTGDRH